jgi:hypothetical protein
MPKDIQPIDGDLSKSGSRTETRQTSVDTVWRVTVSPGVKRLATLNPRQGPLQVRKKRGNSKAVVTRCRER